MIEKLKQFFLGRALRDEDLGTEKFNVKWGLPIYSSDAISSVAYAGEEILLVLIPALFIGGYKYYIISICAIVFLLAILVFSYRQTIEAYPQGGGAYGVTSENLGRVPGLVAGAALMIGYILTVSASAAAATAAVYSAFPVLAPFKVWVAFIIIVLLTWGNLRGMRESAVLFGTPTYIFIGIILVMLVVGFVKYLFFPETVSSTPTFDYTPALSGATLFLVLRAFGSGCTALTGVEAVSNAVPSFKDPAVKNAKKVLVLLASIIFVIFIGVSVLTALYRVTPDPSGKITVIAQLAGRIFGANSIGFYVVQIATVVILALAANTAFAGLPVLLALIAKDGYMPRKLMIRGSKLAYSNGIIMLFVLSSLLIFVFNADTHSLLPLYATGVFLSFTLSQTGMLVRWVRLKTPGWRHKAIINGIGAAMSACTCVIIAVSKFLAGAWMVLVALPVFVLIMFLISREYDRVREDLTVEGQETEVLIKNPPTMKIIVPLSSINRSFLKAMNYAMMTKAAEIEIYHVASSGEDTELLKQKIADLHLPVNYTCEKTEYRNFDQMILRHILAEEKKLEPHQMLTVVMSELVLHHWWQVFLHNQTTMQMKRTLSRQRNISVITVPFLLR